MQKTLLAVTGEKLQQRRVQQRMAFVSLYALLLISIFYTSAMSKTIFHHSGGAINPVIRELHFLTAKQRPIRIVGPCMSACTLYLAGRDVCVSEKAVLKFHQAQRGHGFRLLTRPHMEGNETLMRNYPAKWRNWIESKGGLPWFGWLTISGGEAINRGMVKSCSG